MEWTLLKALCALAVVLVIIVTGGMSEADL